MGVLEKLYRFPPRYGPEWGSGGIFGLRYHRGTLYFTLAFEAEAHFVREDGERVYRFEYIGGKGPRSGGDTYNAVDVVDDTIYFGGWVHAPAKYGGRVNRGGKILFYDKYSHVHSYDIREDRVELLWSDTIRHESRWAGEVSEIIYDPINDRLVVGRADGHENLGIYSIDRRTGEYEILSSDPGLKGSIYLDYACFDIQRTWRRGVEGIQCLDLVTGKWTKYLIDDFSRIAVDGFSVGWPLSGCATSAFGRYFHFVKGGVIVGNPISPEEEEPRFIRLFDFVVSGYAPTRTVALPVGGGVLVAFNSYTHGLIHPRDEIEREMTKAFNTIVGPTILLYITPPMARIVGAFGARITSIETVGSKILLGFSTVANLGADDATPIDVGSRGITAISQDILLRRPPPVMFSIPGERVAEGVWGGIPLWGYREKLLEIKASRDNILDIYEYDFSLPPLSAERTEYRLKTGKNLIDLSGFHGIVSFKFHEEDLDAKIRVVLE